MFSIVEMRRLAPTGLGAMKGHRDPARGAEGADIGLKLHVAETFFIQE